MDASVLAEAASPRTLDDRDDLARAYADHAESARRHEGIRVAATWTLMGLTGILLMYAFWHPGLGSHETVVVAILVCVLSVFGGLLNESHDEGFVHHLRGMRETRAKLQADGKRDRGSNQLPWRDTETGLFLSNAYTSFYQICRFGFLATFVLGLVILFFGGGYS